MPRAKPVWSSDVPLMNRNREKIDASQLEIKDTVVSINRVTKVVKGGKNLSFSALVVVGDGRAVVEAAGIQNVLTKSLGSANPHNVVRATFAGLAGLKDPAFVARMRGKEEAELVGA